MASYDLVRYTDSKTKEHRYIVVPQRCGSSFIKDIYTKFTGFECSYLRYVELEDVDRHFSRDVDVVAVQELNYAHLTLQPNANLKIIYREPIARYASALPMLFGETWENFIVWLTTADLAKGTRARTIAEGFCEYMNIPYDAVLGPINEDTEHKPVYNYLIENLMDTAIAAHPYTYTNIWWEPTFGESHLRPVMLQNAVLACLAEKAEFIELEDLTDWVNEEILTMFDMSTVSEQSMLQDWHNGRSHLPKGSSAIPSDPGKYCLNYLIENQPFAFSLEHDHSDHLPLTFNQYMAPEVDTYNFVSGRKGNFKDREILVDFLIKLFAKYPYAITRSPHLIRWFSSKPTLEKLPPRLAKAIIENIKSGIQYINDRSFFHLSEILDDQF